MFPFISLLLRHTLFLLARLYPTCSILERIKETIFTFPCICDAFHGCQDVTDDLERSFKPLLERGLKKLESADPIERALTYLTLAKTMSSVLQIVLQAKGINHETDAGVRKEHERLAAYKWKLDKVATECRRIKDAAGLRMNVATLDTAIEAAGRLDTRSNGVKSSGKKEGDAYVQRSERNQEDHVVAMDGKPSKKRRRSKSKRPRDAALSFLNSLDVSQSTVTRN